VCHLSGVQQIEIIFLDFRVQHISTPAVLVNGVVSLKGRWGQGKAPLAFGPRPYPVACEFIMMSLESKNVKELPS
jgi:hypothetical protein